MKIAVGRVVECRANDGTCVYGTVKAIGKDGWITVKLDDYVRPRQIHRSTVTVLY